MKITEETRRESYEKLNSATLNKHIINILGSGELLTAREIAGIMYEKQYVLYPVRQAVAPRLTELVDEGVIEVVGKVYDHETKRSVAVYKLVQHE